MQNLATMVPTLLQMGPVVKYRLIFIFFVLCSSFIYSAQAIDPYEGVDVQKVEVIIEHGSPAQAEEGQVVLSQIGTKTGEPFHQEQFDQDLKILSDKFYTVDPTVTFNEAHTALVIQIKVRPKPIVTSYVVEGTSFSKKKILKEGELKTGADYDQDSFYVSINKIREFLIKKGYFQARVSYTLQPTPETNDAEVRIHIHEGPRGRIQKIIFDGIDKKEEKELMGVIRARTFNILTSWATGTGTIKEDEMEQDKQAIVNFFQNHGYVDANVKMAIEETKDNKLALAIYIDKGPLYHINKVTIKGNTIFPEEKLQEDLTIHKGDVYSMDSIRATQEKIKSAYTKDGYLDTSVDHQLNVVGNKHEYDIVYTVEESEQYKVGLIIVSGNVSTNKNVIYNHVKIEPGEVFDSRKIKATQERLQSTGNYKNVHVYAMKGDELDPSGNEYRDVMIEVEEAQTGSMNLFMGFSSTDSIFGGLDLTENNFSLSGFKDVWSQGPAAFRGGGQFFQVRGTAGAKENGVNISWLDPYFNDTLWRFGVDVGYNLNRVISDVYHLHTINTAISATYPINSYFSYGFRYRVKDAIVSISPDAAPLAREEELNSGIVTGIGLVLSYDSTDNVFKPHRGLRSNFESEFAGLVRRNERFDDFPFGKFTYLNSYYLPIWAKGTMKFRGDLRYIKPLWDGKASDFPFNERFFLGGEGTVRGYAPGKIGPSYGEDQPTGGISSELFSVEYLQNILKPLDAFVFFDSGAISMNEFSIGDMKMSYGTGLRFDIGRQLPFVFGVGFPINETDKSKIQRFFFSMAGEF